MIAHDLARAVCCLAGYVGRVAGVGVGGGRGLVWVFCRFTNPWDLVFYSTLMNEVVLVVVPLYLLLVHRDLRQPWEALVATRMGDARTWWTVHVGVAGITAILVSFGMAVLVVVVPLAAGGWTWRWGAFALGHEGAALLQTPAWKVPWRWSLEALGLLSLGLWAMGVLAQVLGLLWRSPWMALVVLVLTSFVSRVVATTAARFLLWWLPGPQFSLTEHWASTTAVVPPGWSVVYAIALLTTAAAVGLVTVASPPWDTTSGGTI